LDLCIVNHLKIFGSAWVNLPTSVIVGAGYIGANLPEPVFPPQSPPTLGIGFLEFVVYSHQANY